MEKTRINNYNNLPKPKRCIQYNNQKKVYLYIKIKAGPEKPNNLDRKLNNK